jgi:hypothetical protein
MARRLSIYALRDDALGLLQSLETSGPLRYVLTGAFDSADTPIYESAAGLPDLGTTQVADTTSSDQYMLFRPPVKVVRRKVPQNAGGVLYFVDPWKNPPCVLFTCGGVFERRRQRCVIAGEIATGYTEGPAVNLFRQVERQVKKVFARVKGPGGIAYVGPSAMRLLREGVRFTDCLGGDSDTDLTWEHVRAADKR